jgi:hypothetical protein
MGTVTSPEVASQEMASQEPEVVNRKREMKGRSFPALFLPVFPALFFNPYFPELL